MVTSVIVVVEMGLSVLDCDGLMISHGLIEDGKDVTIDKVII